MAVAHPLWLQSIRRRPAAFIAILLLAAGATLVSAVTPMLVAAVNASSLREEVARAPFPNDGIAVTTLSAPGEELGVAENAAAGVLIGASSSSDRWGGPQQVDEIEIVPRLFGPGRSPFAARLTLAPFGCAGMSVTAGRCPTSISEGLLPSSLARSTGWAVGTKVTEKTPNTNGVDPPYLPLGMLTVVGVYDDRAGDGPVLADPTRLMAAATPRAVSNLVVGRKGLEDLRAPVQVIGGIRVARPVSQSDVADLRQGVSNASDAALSGDGGETSATVASGLGALLDSIAVRQAAAVVLATPIGVEAVLLAWFALGAVAQRTARSRAAEWGVGRMRGARVRAWLTFVFTEPLAAVLLGAVLGYALALIFARLGAVLLLGGAEDVHPLAPEVLVGIALAAAGSLVALAAASVRAALLPLPQLLQDTAEPRQITRASLVVQVALIAVAVAVAWAALTTDTFSGLQLGLLLPAMAALVTGLLAVRVAIVLVRGTSRRAPRSLAGLVVGRGLTRAPSALVAAQLVLVSAALAACAIQLGLLSASTQTDRADLVTGASRVLMVQAPADASFLDVVRRADPSGRVAMAAEQVVGDDDAPGDKVLAVDTARLAAVSTWRPEWQQGVHLHGLTADGSGLQIRGSRLQLDVAKTVQGSTDKSGPTSVELTVTLGQPAGWTSIDLGRLHTGRLTAEIPCTSACRLISFSLHDASPQQQDWVGQFTLTGLSTDLQPSSVFTPWLSRDRWRDRVVDEYDPARPAQAITLPATNGLLVQGTSSDSSQDPQLEPAVGPDIVPAVIGENARLVRFPGVRAATIGTSLADTPILIRPVAHVTAVPRALRTGVLVDLQTMLATENPSLVRAQQQVWLAPGDHPAVLAALNRAGIRILSSETASSAERAGLDSITNRALEVAGFTALVAVLFGMLALLATRIIDMRERRREWSTLVLAGVPRRRLRGLALVQAAVPALLGALLGVVVGSASASLIASRLPIVVGQSAGPPLDLTIPFAPLALLGAAMLALVLATATAVTAVEVRSAP